MGRVGKVLVLPTGLALSVIPEGLCKSGSKKVWIALKEFAFNHHDPETFRTYYISMSSYYASLFYSMYICVHIYGNPPIDLPFWC